MIDKSEIFGSRSPCPVRAYKTGVSDKPKKSYDPDDTPDGYIGDLPETEHPEKGENFQI